MRHGGVPSASRSGPTACDLFAGAGGLTRGFELEGFHVVAAYETWPAARKCYQSNFRHPVHDFDLSDVGPAAEHISEYGPAVIFGGPPCQDFSTAGKRQEGRNASLTEAFAEIVVRCSPSAFLMENVQRTRTSRAYARARMTLLKHGYRTEEVVLDASLCGAPQLRKRFFCFGLRDASSVALKRLTSSLRDRQAQSRMTVREYMIDELDIEHYYRHPRNYSRRGIYSVDEPSATIRGVNRPVPPNYPGHPLDTEDASRVRALTTIERSRIQTFPQDWSWDARFSKTVMEQLIGNAVPVALASFVACGLRDSMDC